MSLVLIRRYALCLAVAAMLLWFGDAQTFATMTVVVAIALFVGAMAADIRRRHRRRKVLARVVVI